MKLASAKVHFIGVGGIGMCGLAELLSNMGAQVTGSDVSDGANTQRLREIGVNVVIGHSSENIGDAEVVVYSSAVKPSNIEFQAARLKKVPLIPRAEALAEIMRLKRGLAVAGTHGKTTTTSLAASVFLAGHLDPTIVVGGRLDIIKSTAQLGGGEWIVAEADESDGSFTRLSPEVVIVTNIDNDHLDHYGDFLQLQKAFLEFASRVPFYGLAIVCGDDPIVRKVFSEYSKRVIFYGYNVENDVILNAVGDGRYQVMMEGQRVADFVMPMPGRHNALNALAAMLAGREAGVSWEQAKLGVETFKGVDRRFQHKGCVAGVDYYDDYGHHPTEIRAVLTAAREKYPDRRIVVLFQPHRFSRTAACWTEFTECFDSADKLFLLDIYPAGENPIENITAEKLCAEVKDCACEHVGTLEAAGEQLVSELRAGDVFLTLGAGNVWKVGERLCQAQQ
ncbi:MAG: UDP-N-acetylmuramate--L-alanine ligase [Bdellovibrionales bacterium]|nr:UDP-N-acetylmuramate--L-alanine ligase [Bdellovibrionales bacterium]